MPKNIPFRVTVTPPKAQPVTLYYLLPHAFDALEKAAERFGVEAKISVRSLRPVQQVRAA